MYNLHNYTCSGSCEGPCTIYIIIHVEVIVRIYSCTIYIIIHVVVLVRANVQYT